MSRFLNRRCAPLLVATICVTVVGWSGSAEAYRTLADVEGVERPIVVREDLPVVLDTTGLSEPQIPVFLDEIRAALAVWAGVPCADLPVRFAGLADQLAESAPAITVTLATSALQPGLGPQTPGTTELTLARFGDGPTEIASARILLDAAHDWNRHPEPNVELARDLRAVLVHELGHALGLAHPCEPGDGLECTTVHETTSLYPFYVGPSQALLSDDDVAGLCSLYPPAAGSLVEGMPSLACASSERCGAGAVCVDGVCRGATTFGGPCRRGSDCAGGACVFSAGEAEAEAVCSYECGSTEQCPGGTACLRVSGAGYRVCAPPQHVASGCSVGARSSSGSWGWLVALALSGVVWRRRRRVRGALSVGGWVVVSTGLMLGGCGQTHSGADADVDAAVADAAVGDAGSFDAEIPDARIDASSFDSSVPDAGPSDAGSRMDASSGSDGGSSDAGVADASGPEDASAVDASPDDAGAVDGGFLDAEVDSGMADAGSPIDAGPPCTPGETRLAPCGFCGTQGEMCSGGEWIATSTCIGAGACAPGSVETEDLALCERRQRLCLAECAWSDWTTLVPPGECDSSEPGVQLFESMCAIGETREARCNASCEWEEVRPCANLCGGDPRIAPYPEVCVPAGTFIRGSLDYTDTQPVAEVHVDAFYIDRFPVTVDRYRACFLAGDCDENVVPTSVNRNRPMQGLTFQQAQDFCAWDGRRLPTEAEWEKAVRGPAPRTNDYPYNGTEIRCDRVRTQSCGAIQPFGIIADSVGTLPGTRSYYYTFMQWGGGYEYVSDRYSATYYADPSSLTNPQGPDTGMLGLARGQQRGDPEESLAFRRLSLARGGVVRCARSAP